MCLSQAVMSVALLPPTSWHADDPLVIQTNLEAAHAAASAVGNQDGDSTPAAAKGSGPNTNKVP